MIEYNSNSLIVGQIKQILNSFNLPCYRVLTDGKPAFLTKNSLYIYNNKILKYTSSTPLVIDSITSDIVDSNLVMYSLYEYNQSILNVTHRMPITSNIYDYNTHVYLGNFLRFIRDYQQLDLMSMYNCFTNKSPMNLSVVSKSTQSPNVPSFNFNSNDKEYKYYMIPVKFGKKYSIFIDCHSKVEFVCAFLDKDNQLTSVTTGGASEIIDTLYTTTYKSVSGLTFNKSFIYDNLDFSKFSPFDLVEFYRREKDLKLILKLPLENTSSIVVLEGEHTSNSDYETFSTDTIEIFKKYMSVYYGEDANHKIDYADVLNNITKCQKQLTFINSQKMHPFADRLVEYLAGNVITNIDKILANVKRVETNLIRQGVLDAYTTNYKWNDKLRTLLFMQSINNNLLVENFDILGYVDKDVEEKVVKDYEVTGTLEG